MDEKEEALLLAILVEYYNPVAAIPMFGKGNLRQYPITHNRKVNDEFINFDITKLFSKTS